MEGEGKGGIWRKWRGADEEEEEEEENDGGGDDGEEEGGETALYVIPLSRVPAPFLFLPSPLFLHEVDMFYLD
jgi:hypothetical protein